MSQKINATDVTEEEALNAIFFERADEFIKQANEFCRPQKGQQPKPEELRGQVSAAMLFATARFKSDLNKFEFMSALVKINDNIVARLGAIIPEPFAIPHIFISSSPTIISS